MRDLTNSMLDEMIGVNVDDVIENLRIYKNVIGWAFDEVDDLIIETNKTRYILGIVGNHIAFWINGI